MESSERPSALFMRTEHNDEADGGDAAHHNARDAAALTKTAAASAAAAGRCSSVDTATTVASHST